MTQKFIGQKQLLQESAQHLDHSNKIILYLLSHNARLTIADITKASQLSHDTVKARLKQLEENNFITGYTIVFNRRKIGYEVVDLYFNIENLSEDLIQQLKSNKHVYWLATSKGGYNLCISTNCKSMRQVQELIRSIRGRAKVKDMLFLPLYYEHTVPHEYLMDGVMNKPKLPAFKRHQQSMQYELCTRSMQFHNRYDLKESEKRILDILIKDSRTSYRKIAMDIPCSVNTVRRIISDLVRKNVIIQFEPKISTPLFGYYWGLYFVKYKNHDDAQEKEFIQYLKRKPYSHWFSYTSGEYDLILSVHIKDKEQFENKLKHISKKFSNLIQSIEPLEIKKQIKHMNLFLTKE